MAQYVYSMIGVGKTVPPGKKILRDISLSFFPGAKIGVLGLNGAGKSTLLRIMAGEDQEIEGEARPLSDIKIGYLKQEPELNDDQDVRKNVEIGLGEVVSFLEEYNSISERFAEELDDNTMSELLDRQGELAEKIEAQDGWDIDRTLDIAADALRLPPWGTPVSILSGGERRRVALCTLLLSKPDMLLLDEPTNHLDAESVAWLELHLQEYPGCVVAITHDRYFLDNVAGWILELDRGRGIPYEGNYSSWLEQKQKRLVQDEKQDQARQKTLANELEWIRQSPRARQAKSKARITAYDKLKAEADNKTPDTAQIIIPQGPRLGDLVIEASDLSKGFDNHLLFEGLNFKIPPGAIVGIIGANGAGKTTLFNMISGEEKSSAGFIRFGDTVKLGYVDQSREELSDNQTVWEEISEGLDEVELGHRTMQSRAYVSQFNFKGPDQQKKVGQLSGGERNRVHLAKVMKSGANVILLDEPTNDLDVDTLRALEEALLAFPGCILITSHLR